MQGTFVYYVKQYRVLSKFYGKDGLSLSDGAFSIIAKVYINRNKLTSLLNTLWAHPLSSLAPGFITLLMGISWSLCFSYFSFCCAALC